MHMHCETPRTVLLLLALPSVQNKVPGDLADIGFKQAMQQKWLSMDKSSGTPQIVRKVCGGDTVDIFVYHGAFA